MMWDVVKWILVFVWSLNDGAFYYFRYEQGLEDYDEAMDNSNYKQAPSKVRVSPLPLLLNTISASFMKSIQPAIQSNPFALLFMQLANTARMFGERRAINSSKAFETTTAKVIEGE